MAFRPLCSLGVFCLAAECIDFWFELSGEATSAAYFCTLPKTSGCKLTICLQSKSNLTSNGQCAGASVVSLTADEGNAEAVRYRDSAAKLKTPDQIAKAEQLASNWRAAQPAL